MDKQSVDAAILEEVQKALRTLGASPVLIYRVAAMSPAAIYEEMDRLGAPPKLLGAVGSWGDTLEDEMVLDHLREWNQTGDIRFEKPD